MKIWAMADLHLCLGAPEKSMELFGPPWDNYIQKMEENWRRLIDVDDLVLLPGDISWAMKLADAVKDFAWIEALPGTKVMIRGNHDYWWGSASKVQAALPPSLHFIQNNAFHWNGISISGTRLWDLPGLFLGKEEDEKIFHREIERLKLSLNHLDPQAKKRIVMTHYPPITQDLEPSPISVLLEEYHIDFALFGHLHKISKEEGRFGIKNGIHYFLTAADYLNFSPLLVHALK